MSNKTQLQTNNNNLDALITRVNAAKDVAASLPEAGGGSGGSVETCTIVINDPAVNTIYRALSAVSAPIYENGLIQTFTYNDMTVSEPPSSLTIDNVICNSPVSICTCNPSTWTCDGCESLDARGYFIVVTSTNANTIGTITLTPIG